MTRIGGASICYEREVRPEPILDPPGRGHQSPRWSVLFAGFAMLMAVVGAFLLGRGVGSESGTPPPVAAADAPVTSTTLTSASAQPAAADDVVGGQILLPDPWAGELMTEECDNQGTTAEMARCAQYERAAAAANLRVAMEVLVRGTGLPELRELQAEWEDGMRRLCAMSEVGGSMDRHNTPHCHREAIEDRVERLRSLAPWVEHPLTPADLWQTPLVGFDDSECVDRLVGQEVAEPRGGTLISGSSQVELEQRANETVTGTLNAAAQIETAAGETLSLSSSATLWGHRLNGVAAGVYVDTQREGDSDSTTGFGYWWIEFDANNGVATGEIFALFHADAIGALDLSVVEC